MLLALLLATVAHAAQPFADAMATGDCSAVLAQLPSPARDGERLVAGLCLERSGRHVEAAAILGKIGSSGVLSDYGRWVRAEALADGGKPKEALTVLSGLKLPGEPGRSVRLLRDRLLVETGRGAEAAEDLRALTETDLRDEARYWLAVGAERRNDRAAAEAMYWKIWSTSTRGPWAGKASAKLQEWRRSVPDTITPAGRDRLRARISALRKDQQHTAALALYDVLWTAEPPITNEQVLAMARVRFDAHDYQGACNAYARVLGSPETAIGAPADLFEYALATARSGDYDRAKVIYRRLIVQHPTSEDADFASFKLGYMEFDRGKFTEAREELAAHLERRPDSKRRDETLWFAGWSAWRLGDRKSATRDFQALLAQFPSSSLAPAAAYWSARALGAGADAAGEREALQRVVDRWPVSGHAWFAAARLGTSFPPKEVVARPEWPSSFASRTDVRRAETLMHLGLRNWAQLELLPVIAATKGNRAASLAAAHAFLASDDAKSAYKLASPYCDPVWKGGDPVAQQACTPRMAGTIVDTVAARHGLHGLVPFGIMTAESGLRPEVTSIAGARGLMQLMPGVAEKLHRELYPERTFDQDDLYAAPYNASLGTMELGKRWTSLDGTLSGSAIPAVIASYNGGEEAVRRWIGAAGGKPEFDEFAENIGYTETRQYVRRVLGFVMAYRWVYGDPA